MKIYTKTGDRGETSLLGNTKVYKNDPRVEAYGTIDEANSYLGLARCHIHDVNIKEILLNIQKKLFDVAAELASIDREHYPERIKEDDVKKLENIIDEYAVKMPQQHGFSVPGGRLSAELDVARTIIRRAERCIISLNLRDPVNPYLIAYINRLSDLIYTLARYLDYVDIYEKVREVVKERSIKKVNLNIAKEIVKSAEDEAQKLGIPAVITVVDDGGNLILQERMDGALLASIDISRGKAYTAVALKTPTDELKNLAGINGELFGINSVDSKFVLFGGGIPLKINESVIGGLGVSGGSVEQDIKIANAGLKRFKEVLHNGD